MAVDLPSAFFLGSGTPGRPLTKALRRWRAAFAAVFSCKALAGHWGLAEALRRGPCHVAVDVGSAASAALFPAPATARSVGKSARPRWLAAFAVIRSCRAFLTVSGNRVIDILHRRPSFVALDIGAGDDQGAATVVVPCAASAVLEAKLSLVEHGRLVEVVKGKSADGLRQLRGVEEIAASLASNTDTGIDVGEGDSLLLRQKLFGSNTYKKPPARGFMSFVWEALKDPMLVILLACAALSLGFGMKEHGVKEGWYDGVSILVAVFLVVSVSAVSNFRQARRFAKLSNECGNIRVRVVRDGRRQEVSIFDVVVGDVVCLQIGDQVPADGLFADGHSLQVDESSMTGESDHVAVDARRNPFLASGTKIADGYARMLVTSVGMDTTWGEMMSSINHDADEPTPLQERLQKLTSSIGKIGTAVAALVLVVLLVRHFTGSTRDENGNPKFDKNKVSFDSVVNALVSIVSDAVTIVVVAIPEGLPLAVTLTLAYSMKRMMADKAMVRKLPACETMGSVTTICTDKTGTLTLNQMQVTKFWIGEEEVVADKSSTAIVDDRLLELLHQGVGLNTTATVYKSSSSSEPEFSGSPTEKAILSWAVKELGMDAEAQKRRWEILHVEAFNSDKKRSGVMARSKEGEHVINVHWKGAAEMILGMCSHYCNSDGVPRELDAEKRTMAEQIIEGMAASSLRCIAFAYKRQGIVENYCSGNDGDVDSDGDGDGEDGVRKLADEKLTLLGVVGLKDPCRPGARKAVEACRAAGVAVKMITGDNIFTAKSIAFECGILRADDGGDVDGAVVEGKTFRSWSEEKRMEMVDGIRVMARSSPFDKLLMVQCLKRKHHVVAVTGDGTNDAPALREADVGLSMGVQGTEVAKESSDIVILDDNFASVATVLMWGRCVYSNIQKFIQFQLTVNVAALVINFVAAVSSGEVPLTTVQLLWVNLIMDTLGALALATEKPTEDLARKPPVGRTAPLITNVMWRNLLAQALFQVAVLLVLQFRGESMFGVGERVKNTLVFNTFVLCQVFNEFNARRLEKKNVFEGIHKNRLFLGIIAATLVLQVLMVEFMRRFAGTERLDWGQWGFCVGIAFLSWPIGWAFKWVPVGDKPISRLFKF